MQSYCAALGEGGPLLGSLAVTAVASEQTARFKPCDSGYSDTSRKKAARKSNSVAGRSSCDRCPHPGSTASREPGSRSDNSAAAAGVLMWSCSPVITKTGSEEAAMSPRRRARSSECTRLLMRHTYGRGKGARRAKVLGRCVSRAAPGSLAGACCAQDPCRPAAGEETHSISSPCARTETSSDGLRTGPCPLLAPQPTSTSSRHPGTPLPRLAAHMALHPLCTHPPTHPPCPPL